MCIQVGSPPKNATQNELALYRTLAFLRERDCEDRSWPTAAMLGVPVQDPITCRPIGVLLIERNRHKAKIEGVEVADTAHDTYVCAMILQGRL
jgi:hypothetical protein